MLWLCPELEKAEVVGTTSVFDCLCAHCRDSGMSENTVAIEGNPDQADQQAGDGHRAHVRLVFIA